VLGNFSISLFVQPIHQLRNLISEIDDSLDYYSTVYANPEYAQPSKKEEAVEKFRYLASQLKAKANAIPWYSLWQFLRFVPQKTNIVDCSSRLSSLTDNIRSGESQDISSIQTIRSLIDIKSVKQ
jgi:hypothetical protein